MINQYTEWDRESYSFFVAGVRFLREDYSPVAHEEIEFEKTYWLEYITTAGKSPPDDLSLRYEDAEGHAEIVTVNFKETRAGFYSTSHLAEIRLKPTKTAIIGEAEPCTDCANFEVSATAFKIEVGKGGASAADAMDRIDARMYGQGLVKEIPLGEHRRLTYAVQRVPTGAPGAGDYPIVVEWKDGWPAAGPSETGLAVPWFSAVTDPVNGGSALEYLIDSAENSVTIQYNYLDPDDTKNFAIRTLSFRNITDGADDAGRILAFHIASDQLHPLFDQTNPPIPNSFLPPDPALRAYGYGSPRVPMIVRLNGAADPNDWATVQLRGVARERIQSDWCRQENQGTEDTNCASNVGADPPADPLRFNIDNIISYFCDRHGIPSDVAKALILKESGFATRQATPGVFASIRIRTNAYKYEPYTFDFKYFAGGGWDIQAGRKCEDLSVYTSNAHRIEVEPYCMYAFAGRTAENNNPPSRAVSIPPGSMTLDLFDAGLAGHLQTNETLRLFTVTPRNSPACITPYAGSAPPPVCNPPQGEFGARINDWIQVGHRRHGKPGSVADLPMDEYPAASPVGQRFSIEYGPASSQLNLGLAAPAGLSITLYPQVQRDIGYGTGTDRRGEKILTLPAGIADLETLLNGLADVPDCKIYPTANLPAGDLTTTSISGWISTNAGATGCGGFNFMRDGTSHEHLMINLFDNSLYDPQYSVNSQYLLSGSFGLMQYGVLNHDYPTQRGKMMRIEYDFGDEDSHLFDQVLNPAVSIQVGTALASFILNKSQNFESACGINCEEATLRQQIKEMLGDYNGAGDPYANAVLKQMHLFSQDPTIWGATVPP